MQHDKRNYPIGAEIINGGVDFRVFASNCKRVEVAIEGEKETHFFPLVAEHNGYFSGFIEGVYENALYRFRLDNSKDLFPDPSSRFQPSGPFGPSQVINPKSFSWSDQKWKGKKMDNQIIYEMHIGTFTQEGTFSSAREQIQCLADLGIKTIEIMPINDFPGKFGWGYDGVNLFAPTRLYGSPDDVKKFIDEAHKHHIGVILDVVYNHFGPEGNYILKFSEDYLQKENTEWGSAVNFDHPEIRSFFLTNAIYWIKEYHFDGLRIDAIHSIVSHSKPHFLEYLSRAVREAAPERDLILIAENEKEESFVIKPYADGGYGFDASWNDDFHHTARVRLTGHHEAYTSDYRGTPQEFISCAKQGFLYQGQYYFWQNKCRGTPSLGLSHSAFVTFIQNHDQIANSGTGERINELSDVGNFRAMTCLLIISPNTPMLFQGQEFASSSPFYYFADHTKELNELIRKSRIDFLKQFPNLDDRHVQKKIPDPSAFSTFQKCKLNFTEREFNRPIYLLHRDLIHLRTTDPVLSGKYKVEGAVLNNDSFLIRFLSDDIDRLLIINFGLDLILNPQPEPLLAPPCGHHWEILLSTESSKYGGQGVIQMKINDFKISGHSALLLKSEKNKSY